MHRRANELREDGIETDRAIGGGAPSAGAPMLFSVYEVRPELLEKFPKQFAAVLALNDWAKDHRPSGPPSTDPAGELILVTYARSSKTYQAAIMLAGFGYGAQAGMLSHHTIGPNGPTREQVAIESGVGSHREPRRSQAREDAHLR